MSGRSTVHPCSVFFRGRFFRVFPWPVLPCFSVAEEQHRLLTV